MGLQLEEWKKAKKNLNLSYDDLAKMTGYSRSTITNIFCGYIELPRHETVQAIEKALGLDKTQATEERELKELYAGATEEKKQLFDLIMSLSDEQVDKLTEFADFLISKREK